MIKQSLKSISIVFRYAKAETILKILQLTLAGILTPMSIYFTQRLVDGIPQFIHGESTLGVLLFWCGLLMFSMVFSSGFFDGMLYISIKRKLNRHMTPIIVEKFKRLDYSCFEDRDTQDTISRMSSDPQDKIFLLFLNITGVSSMFITLICSAAVVAQAGIWFMLVFMALLLPMTYIDFKSADMMNTMFNNQSTDERRLHYLGSLLSDKASIMELKIFGAKDYISSKWRDKAKTVLDERLKTTINSQKLYLVSTILFKAWSFFVILSLVYAIIGGRITIGLFTALIISTGTVLNNADMLSHSVQNLRKRYLLIHHYYKFLSLPEIPPDTDGHAIENPHIIFDNVTFTYPKTDKQVLKGVSFEILPGERVSLAGENGAGKSTIIKLLCRLYRPDSGSILINGININELSQKQLRDAYSVVFQDFCSYTLTLRENIAFGNIRKLNDDPALRLALKQGLADGLPVGLDQNLGKLEADGVDLSGGQWQRIAIARACAADSAFVILDEPTAALDPVAESEMYKAFSEVLRNKGCIMISHRLASAKMADKIFVIDGGIVSESGSHDELMKAGGLYAKMFRAQSAWYQNNS